MLAQIPQPSRPRPAENVPGRARSLTAHPAASIFPMMSPAEFEALRDDIAEHGLQEPIVLDADGQIVDGRNRALACEQLGVEPTYKRMPPGADAFSYAVSANLHRRHLNSEQRREVISALLNANPERSDRSIARTVGVSPSTVGAVRGGGVSKLDTKMARLDRVVAKWPAASKAIVYAVVAAFEELSPEERLIFADQFRRRYLATR